MPTTFVPKMMKGTAGDFQMARDEKHEQQLRLNGYIDSPDPGHIAQRQENERKNADTGDKTTPISSAPASTDVNAALAELKTKAEVVDFGKSQFGLDLNVNDSRDELESAIKAEAKRARRAA